MEQGLPTFQYKLIQSLVRLFTFSKGLFPLGLRVDSQASRRTKCCELAITLVNVITLHSVGLSESTTSQR